MSDNAMQYRPPSPTNSARSERSLISTGTSIEYCLTDSGDSPINQPVDMVHLRNDGPPSEQPRSAAEWLALFAAE